MLNNTPWSTVAVNHFLASVDRHGQIVPGVKKTDCWEYVGSLPSNHGWGGGGTVALDPATDGASFAHANRFAWQHYNGAFKEPNAVHVSSKCGNPNCCNPAHLRLVDAHNHRLVLVEHSATGVQPVAPILRKKAA
jgi:hypothetical protein